MVFVVVRNGGFLGVEWVNGGCVDGVFLSVREFATKTQFRSKKRLCAHTTVDKSQKNGGVGAFSWPIA